MPSIAEIIAIITGLGGIGLGIWNAFLKDKSTDADLTKTYQKIAGIDATAFLKLKEDVEKLKQPRKFRGVFELEVDADGARITRQVEFEQLLSK